jgi:hypothetical protein
MKCANCGNMLSPASTYCPVCGATVEPPPAGESSTSEPTGRASGQPEITPYANNQPLRAQTVFYGRYGMRGGMSLPQPSSLTPTAAPTPGDGENSRILSTTPGPQAESTAASIQSAMTSASSTPTAILVASPPETQPRKAAALPLARTRPLAGRLLVLGGTGLLLALVIGLSVAGYQVYQKSQVQAHATATAAARVHATATAIAQASATASAPLLIDPLTANTNGWMVDGKTSFFENNQYHLHNPDPTMTLNSYYEQQSFSDFKIQVTATAYTDANPNADVVYAYGLILRADPTTPGNKYVFFVSPAGTYDFERHDVNGFYNNGWTDLLNVPWASSPAIKTGEGATNTLAVLARGTTFTLFINGQQVATVVDANGAPFESGLIGLMVEGAGMEAGFSNLQVYGPGA